MSLFQQAAHLNNKAVQYLLQNDQLSAIQTLATSVKLMKAAITTKNNTSSSSSKSTNNTNKRIQGTKTIAIPSMQSSETIVFNQAIIIPENQEQEEEDQIVPDEIEMNIYTSAVVFNLALAHHASQDDSALCIVKAEKLYAMVISLLDDNTLNFHTAMMVKLACISNLSQIQYCTGDDSYSKQARKGLNEVSCFLRESSHQSILEDPEIQSLLMNVLLLKAPTVAAAA